MSDYDPRTGTIECRLTLEEMAFGCEQTVSLDVEGPCINCEGTRRDGTEACAYCGGTGTMTTARDATVAVPAGARDGDLLCVDGSANVIVRQRRHPVFERDGLDLRTSLDVPPHIMSDGGMVEIETLEDTEALLRIDPGREDGDVARMEHEGMPSREDPSHRGDLLVTLRTAEDRPVERPRADGDPRRSWAGLPFILIGLGIIVFAFILRVNESFCDPAVYRCVVVVNGVATGESDKSLAEQHSDANVGMIFGFLIGLAFMLPGFWMLHKTLFRNGVEASSQHRPD